MRDMGKPAIIIMDDSVKRSLYARTCICSPRGPCPKPGCFPAATEALKGRLLRYYIESYGCQMNDHDSEKLAGMLCEAGFQPAPSKEEADFILFNTCCIREHAEKRVFGNVGALKKQKDENPSLCIAVCGCMMPAKGCSRPAL